MLQLFGPRDGDGDDDSWPAGYDYIDISGGLHNSVHDTIEANLGHEEGWDTGAGCGQDADNISDSNGD